MIYSTEETIEELFEMDSDFGDTTKHKEKVKQVQQKEQEELAQRKREYDKLKLRYLQSLGMVSSPIVVERTRSDPAGALSGIGQALKAHSLPISIPTRPAHQSDSEDDNEEEGHREEYEDDDTDDDSDTEYEMRYVAMSITELGRTAPLHANRPASAPSSRGRSGRFIPPHELVHQHTFSVAAGSPLEEWRRRAKHLAKGY